MFPAMLLLIGVTLVGQTPSWRATMVSPNEPGEPLILSGTVYQRDGRTPAAGVRVRIYHTDASGVYSRDGDGESSPRLQAIVHTNEDGRYEVRTIVPGAYPGQRTTAAHIHMMVSVSGGTEQNATFSVAGDPRLTQADYQKHGQAGTFSAIRPIERDPNGSLRAVRDIRLR